MTPLISIIVPMYNRERLVSRALDSCLRQRFTDWEAIVVDDASTDNSRAVVEGYHDSRIRLLTQSTNQGQCVARNAGASVATGEWLLFLDSDDELTNQALELVQRRAAEVGNHVGRMFFACRWDDGTVSPDPPFDGRELTYEDFIRWIERLHGRPTETISAARRTAFMIVPYPNRRSHESGHNLDFVKRYNFVGYPDVVRLYHLDADNRMTDDTRRLDKILEAAPGLSWMAESVLAEHGDALRRWSPAMYQDYLRTAGLYQLLSGRRRRGISLSFKAWMHQPQNAKAIALLFCSWLPVRTLATVKMRWSS